MGNENSVTVAHFDLFPFKSLDAISVQSVNVLSSGALEGDRRWAIFDREGKYVNGKRTPLVHQIRSRFGKNHCEIEIAISEENATTKPGPHSSWQRFELPDQQEELEQLFSEHFKFPVQIEENRQQGFPDDLKATGPTIIGTATLEKVAEWFPELNIAEIRKRFRTNITIQTDVPFWEDRLFGPPDSPRLFCIGEVEFLGINPCQRCVVPARDSETGEAISAFQKKFAKLREESLPEFSDRSQFDHFYRLAVNTNISPNNTGTQIRCGDVVKLRDHKK